MRVRNIFVAAILSLLCVVPALAQSPRSEFSALQGVNVQALSAEEMSATAGRLNAYDTAAGLYALAASVTNPKLQASITARADALVANAETINAFYAKLGVLTTCQSCTP